LNRLYIVAFTCAALAVSDLTAHFAIALIVGVLVGAGMFLLSMSHGGGLRPIGMAAPHLMKDIPKRPPDPNANIGCALAAAGIASSVVTNMHYPLPFRDFYGACIVIGIGIALVIAFRSRNIGNGPNPPSTDT
jgi:hypothetical protein